MKAGRRLATAIGAAALGLAAAPGLAQSVPQTPPAEAPPSDTIGPSELQNYSINGTVTRPAEPRPQRTAPARTVKAAPVEPRAAPAPQQRPAQAPTKSDQAEQQPRIEAVPAPARRAPAAQAPSVTVPLPPAQGTVGGSAAPLSPSEPNPSTQPDDAFHGALIGAWPWLLAALALVFGCLFLWRNGRMRQGYAGGPGIDEFVAPAPARTPAPAPAPRAPEPRVAPPAPSPSSLGIVSTRIRLRIELQFTPLRCSVDNERVVVEFDLELINQGSAPARAVLVEATLFNAGPAQDQAIGAFFASPVGQGERIALIAPLKRISVRSQVIAPRSSVQLFQVGGRAVFVPLIAFNALYRWGNGEGQTSAAFLLGRDTGKEKLGALGADRGARQYLKLGARMLPEAVRI